MVTCDNVEILIVEALHNVDKSVALAQSFRVAGRSSLNVINLLVKVSDRVKVTKRIKDRKELDAENRGEKIYKGRRTTGETEKERGQRRSWASLRALSCFQACELSS